VVWDFSFPKKIWVQITFLIVVFTKDEIYDFVSMAIEANLLVALARWIKADHAEEHLKIQPDIIGLQGTVYKGPIAPRRKPKRLSGCVELSSFDR